MTDLDPRWEWIDVRSISDPGPVWIKGQCHHAELVSVDSIVTGQEVARLCVTCDGQLPPTREPAMWTIPNPPGDGIWMEMESIRG